MGNHVKIVGNHLDQEIVIHLLVLIINHRILVILLLFLWVVVLPCPMLNVLLQDHRNWDTMWELSRTRCGSFLFDTELCPVCGGLGRVFTAPPPRPLPPPPPPPPPHPQHPSMPQTPYMPQYQPQYTNYGSKR